MVRHDINIDVARETVYELVGPELTGKLRRNSRTMEVSSGSKVS